MTSSWIYCLPQRRSWHLARVTLGPGMCLLPSWWKFMQIIGLKNPTIIYTSSAELCLTSRRLRSLETPLECAWIRLIRLYICQCHQRIEHAAGGGPGQNGHFLWLFLLNALRLSVWLDRRARRRNLFGLCRERDPLPSLLSRQYGGEKIHIHIWKG